MKLENVFLSLISTKPYLIRRVGTSWVVSIGPTAGVLPDFTDEKTVLQYNIYTTEGDCIGVALLKEEHKIGK